MPWWGGAGSADPSGLPGIIGDIVDGANDAVDSVVNFADFAQDPAGYITSLLQAGCQAVAQQVIPPMLSALHPDYSAEWWLSAYRVAFGMAMLLGAVLFVVAMVNRRKGKNSGREIVETMFVALPAFIVASMFGPLVGISLSKVFIQLEDSLAMWAVDGTTKDYFGALGERAADKDAASLFGAALISQITLLFLFLGLLVVVFVLLIQLATMYLTGALMALCLVWAINPATRHFAKVGPMIWLALCFSHSLLIFLVGLVFRAVAGLQVEATADGALSTPFATFVNLALPAVLICLIVFAPMALLKMGGQASAPLGGGGQSRDGGFNSPPQAPQLPRGSGGGGGSGPQGPNQAAKGNSGGDGGGSPAWTPSTQPATSNATTSMGSVGSSSSAGQSVGAAAGKRASQQAASKGATSAATKTATAGAAASGVGAPVAVGALLANSALKAAAMAVRAGHQAAEQAGDAGTND